MLKIRLRRAGKRHQPTYRVVIVEHTAPAQGSYLEAVGTYNPRASQFTVNQDRVLHWLNHGAQPSERMAKLLQKAGVKHKLIVLPDYDRKPKKAAKKAAPETVPATTEPADQTGQTPAPEVSETDQSSEEPTTSTQTAEEESATEAAPAGESTPEADAELSASEKEA